MGSKYLVVSRPDVGSLEDWVNRLIGEGYKPMGGLVYTGTQYRQALYGENIVPDTVDETPAMPPAPMPPAADPEEGANVEPATKP